MDAAIFFLDMAIFLHRVARGLIGQVGGAKGEIEKLGLLSKANPTLSDDLRAHTVQALFGTIWTRDGLDLKTRSLVTLTSLIALNRDNELRLHFRGARNLGITRETIEEVILHVAHYAGWPVSISASAVLDEVWKEMDEETQT
jgi:alkylhydroperoxidase/carboxymuconolactone decarboxylase family protein YurZ